MVNESFWKGKNVFVTGHTGFKGSWLSLWLLKLGAKVTGYAYDPPTDRSLFKLCGIDVDPSMTSITGDVRKPEALRSALTDAEPDIVIHMAAQPLVRASYENPVETYETNILGTVYLHEAVRYAIQSGIRIKALINVTSDKCYENKGWVWGYRESDSLGGYDPYSSSKACSELVTASYRNSFFHPDQYAEHGLAVATVRAGNVIGGGDWSRDRLIPDCLQALLQGETVNIRNPNAIRPWQHVLEPLSGYLMLARHMVEEGPQFSESWNFGPKEESAKPVGWIVDWICKRCKDNMFYKIDPGPHPYESAYLKLDYSKAKARLGWSPQWSLEQALEKTVEWAFAFRDLQDLRAVCYRQIDEYTDLLSPGG